MDDVDILAPDVIQGLHSEGYRIIQLVIGIMERPYANAHYIPDIHDALENMDELLNDAGYEGDGNMPIALARRAQPITTGVALKMAAQSGIRDLIQSLFEPGGE